MHILLVPQYPCQSATLTALPGAAREDDSGDTGRSITALPRPDKPAEDRPDCSVRVERLPDQHDRSPERFRPAELAKLPTCHRDSGKFPAIQVAQQLEDHNVWKTK